MRDQRQAVRGLFAEESFTLIVLDACRYDALARLVEDGRIDTPEGHIEGSLSAASAAATHTYVWFREVFTATYPRTQVFSGHPALNSAGKTPGSFLPTVNQHVTDIDHNDPWSATDHFESEKVQDAWMAADDIDDFSTPPRHVAAAVESVGYDDRNIVWLMSPHHPYAGDGETPRERYEQTLVDTLPILRDVADAPGRTVITGDHGEAFGHPSEYGLDIEWKDILRHEPGVHVPELLRVPWFEVDRVV